MNDLETLRAALITARTAVRCEDGGVTLCSFCRGRVNGLTEAISLVGQAQMREPASTPGFSDAQILDYINRRVEANRDQAEAGSTLHDRCRD